MTARSCTPSVGETRSRTSRRSDRINDTRRKLPSSNIKLHECNVNVMPHALGRTRFMDLRKEHGPNPRVSPFAGCTSPIPTRSNPDSNCSPHPETSPSPHSFIVVVIRQLVVSDLPPSAHHVFLRTCAPWPTSLSPMCLMAATDTATD